MSTTRVIVDTYEDTSDPNVTPGQITQSGSGRDWTIGSETADVGLSNTTPDSKTLKFAFQNDFRTTSPTYNVSSNRCIVRYKAKRFIDLSIISGGLGVTYEITYVDADGNTNVISSFSDSTYGLQDFYQTGSDVQTTTANLNQITYDNNWISVQINTDNINTNGLHAVTLRADGDLLANTGPAGSLLYQWEGNLYAIDGTGGDNDPNLSSSFSLQAIGGLLRHGEANINASFTLTEDSVSVITGVEATLSSNFSTSFTGNVKSDTTKTLSTQCELLATTNNFVFGAASISSAFTQSQTPFFIIGDTLNFVSTATQTATGGIIYDLAGVYTWDSLTGGWDDWPYASWIRPYIVSSAFDISEQTSFIIDINKTLDGVFTVSEDTALNQPAQATLSAIFSISPTAQGIIDQGSSITSNFSTTALANTIYDQLIDFDGVLSAELIANLIIGSLLATPSSQFTLASSPTFKPGGEVDMSAAFEILDKIGNMIYDADASLSALYSELVIGSITQSADFYNTFKILQETRNILIGIENRQYIISEEKRLNTIKAESRNVLVPEETRRFKLKVAPITNRFTTPKVRSPQ